MSLQAVRLAVYHVASVKAFRSLPGFRHFRKWANSLVRDRIFQHSYLTGKVWANPLQAMGRDVFAGSIYEPQIVQVIQYFVRAGFAYVDIGANNGLHVVAAGLARTASQQPIIAFEPETTAFNMLRRNVDLNGLANASLYHQAVGAEYGHLRLNVSTTQNQGNHSFIPRDGTKPGDQVEVVMLDQVMNEQHSGLNERIFIKLDVEGFEPSVIQGARDWLTRLTDVALICEISPDLLAQIGSSEQALISQIAALGFLNSRVIHDPDTFDEQGNKRHSFYNRLFWKGALADQLVGQLAPEIFATDTASS